MSQHYPICKECLESMKKGHLIWIGRDQLPVITYCAKHFDPRSCFEGHKKEYTF